MEFVGVFDRQAQMTPASGKAGSSTRAVPLHCVLSALWTWCLHFQVPCGGRMTEWLPAAPFLGQGQCKSVPVSFCISVTSPCSC